MHACKRTAKVLGSLTDCALSLCTILLLFCSLQGFRLLSLSAYVPNSSARAANKLIRSLPLTH